MELLKTGMGEPIEDIPGLFIYRNYLTKEEQDEIIKEIYEREWDDSGIRRKVQQFIRDYDYSSRNPVGRKKDNPPPSILKLKQQLETTGVFKKSIDQIIVNKYEPGEGISAHADHEAFDDTITTISLGSSATMIFCCKINKNKICVRLNPGDMATMTGESRCNWTHEIPARKNDRMMGDIPVLTGGKWVPRKTRISVTFRRYK